MNLSYMKNKRTLTAFLGCTAVLIACAFCYKKTAPASVKSPSGIEGSDSAKIRSDYAISSVSQDELAGNSVFLSVVDDKLPALIQEYFTAKLDVDQTILDTIIVSDGIDYNKLQREIEYIKSYQNITTYVTEGINEIDYIAYVSYDVEFPKTSSYAPAMDEYYIVYNDQTDSYQIYMKSLSEDTMNYVLNQRSKPEVQEIINSVTNELFANLEADPNLLDIYNSFLNGSR